MKTREETAVEFAKAMGGTLHSDGDGATRISGPHSFEIPPADAPLPDALAFAGRVAEALGDGSLSAINNDGHAGWMVRFRNCDLPWQLHRGTAPDLSHAAMLAAISAKRGAL